MKFSGVRFDAKIAEAVAEETNLPFVTAENKFEALVSLSLKFLIETEKRTQAKRLLNLIIFSTIQKP